MAKVMISLPDDLLERIDAEARRRGSTRSGTLRALALQALDGEADALRARLRDLHDHAAEHGGSGVEALRAGRAGRLADAR